MKIHYKREIMTTLKTLNLTKKYNSKLALEDFSFTVESSNAIGLMGNNGSGKSTVLKMLAGLFPPSGGKILMDGTPLYEQEMHYKTRIGFQPEQIEIPSLLTLFEYCCFVARVKSVENPEKTAEELFDRLNLPEAKKIFFQNASLGMKRKTAIVAAFISNPDVLILDEPTNGLDLKNQKILQKMIQEKLNSGKIVILASHHPEWTESLVNQVIILESGKIRLSDSMVKVCSEYGALRTAFEKVTESG